MRYIFYRRGNGRSFISPMRCDLDARKRAESLPDVMRVETEHGRVVWRRVPVERKEPLPDLDIVNWFD